MKYLLLCLLTSLTIYPMQSPEITHLCEDEACEKAFDPDHIDITGLQKEMVLQFLFSFVETNSLQGIKTTLNEDDFEPIRQKNWQVPFLKGYVFNLNLSGDKVNVATFNYIYGKDSAHWVIKYMRSSGCCLK